jgi:hypothetical protein
MRTLLETKLVATLALQETVVQLVQVALVVTLVQVAQVVEQEMVQRVAMVEPAVPAEQSARALQIHSHALLRSPTEA